MRLPSWMANVGLSLAVTALGLGALELAGRALEPERQQVERADYLWDWEEHWEGDFYTLARSSTGWPPGEEINGDGLRDRHHSVAGAEGVPRLAFLGDSVTFGAGIEAEEAYPQVLQRLLDAEGREVEVFNVALWGWSTRQQRIAYRRLLRRYRPDRVVVGICLNDIPEMQNNLARPPALVTWLHERSAFVRWLVDAESREIQSVDQLFSEPTAARVTQAYRLFFDELRALRDEVMGDGGELGLLVFPFRFQVLEGAPPALAQEEIAGFCRAEGLRCLDLLDVLLPAGGGAFVDYDHLSPAGARRVAQALLQSDLLPAVPGAAELLGRAGIETPGARRAALTGSDPGLRAAAAWAAGELGDAGAVEGLAQAVVDPVPGVRRRAARALGKLGDRRGLPSLLAALDDPEAAVRWEAARAIHAIGLRPGEGVAALAKAVAAEDDYVKAFATWTLGEMGPAAREAVPALAAALPEEGSGGRSGAAVALAKMGSAAAAAVPALRRELEHAKAERRWRAARTLGRIGKGAREAVPALAAGLRDPAADVRQQCARALGRIGEASQPAVPALVVSLEDEDERVREAALEALSRIPGR
jgi:HEAT repeat protein/lysophospholipase L1-like esterase